MMPHHLANTNPMLSLLAERPTATFFVQGPAAYVTSYWGGNPRGVPTSYYQWAQAELRVELVRDEAGLRQILEALLAPGDRAWIVPVAGHASWSLAQLRQALRDERRDALAGQLRAAPDAATAIGAAADRGPMSGPVIVAGSLYLIGQLLAAAEP
jgi:predicted FMN-binding regulatory protein PaiB